MSSSQGGARGCPRGQPRQRGRRSAPASARTAAVRRRGSGFAHRPPFEACPAAFDRGDRAAHDGGGGRARRWPERRRRRPRRRRAPVRRGGTRFGGVFARVFGGVRTGARRWTERGECEATTANEAVGRRATAAVGARARDELAYGDEHGEQRAREVGGKLTGGVAVKWARRRDGAGVGDGDRRRDPKKGTTRERRGEAPRRVVMA
jgi:hypothetical protein